MLADFCKHRFLLSLSPAIPTQCAGVHKMKVTNFFSQFPYSPLFFLNLPITDCSLITIIIYTYLE